MPDNFKKVKESIDNSTISEYRIVHNRSFPQPKKGVLVKNWNLILAVVLLMLCLETFEVVQNGIDLDRHVPFLFSAAVLFLWAVPHFVEWMKKQERNDARLVLVRTISANGSNGESSPIQVYLDDADFIDPKTSGAMRTNTPSGLG